MNVEVPERVAQRVVGLLKFVAAVCASRPEELNVALCRHTGSYFPAHFLQEELSAAAAELSAAMTQTHEVAS